MAQVGSRVLLVDDNHDAVDMFSELLGLYNVESRVAYDGYSAITLLAEWPANIVFLDIVMPGLDGYETAIAMRSLPGFADLPIVAWSGWDRQHNDEAFSRAGMVCRLTKPVDLQDVLDLIHLYEARR